MSKRKSFYYRDWKYKIRWDERATPFMTKHMNINYLTGKYLRNKGLFKIRSTPMLKLKFRFRSKKSNY